MIGKFICLLLAMAAVQAYHGSLHPPVEPLDLIHTILDQLKDLIQEAEGIVERLESTLSDGGKELIDQANAVIEGVVSAAELFAGVSGACGQAALPDIEKAKTDAQAEVNLCVSTAAEQGDVLAKDLDVELQLAETVVTEVEDGIDNCNAQANAAICLAGLAITEVPKINNIIDKVTPLVTEIYKLENSLVSCVEEAQTILSADIATIEKDIENCLS